MKGFLMENELEFTTRDKIAVAVVGVAVAYSTYQLGRLGVDWSREGIRAIKSKMNSNK